MLLLAVLAVVAIVWLLIARPWSGAASEADPTVSQTQDAATDLPVPASSASAENESDPTPEPSATGDAATPDPAASADAGAQSSAPPTAAACTAREVKVEAATDKETYGSGQNPQLSIELTNTSEKDCTINVGTSAQSFTIMSGDDTWWRSTDCQTESSDMLVTLAAGQTVSSAAPLTWDRTRSDVSSCASTDRQIAAGGGASYHLGVTIGGIPSTQSAQFLLY